MSYADLAIRVNSRDGAQDAFERAETTCRILRDFDINGGNLERSVLPVVLRNW